MGEVIEINMLSNTADLMNEILGILKKQFGLEQTTCSIRIMDNWHYDNLFEVDSVDRAKKFIDNKIVTITESMGNTQIGVSIEKTEQAYVYQFWINPDKEVLEQEYIMIQDRLVHISGTK